MALNRSDDEYLLTKSTYYLQLKHDMKTVAVIGAGPSGLSVLRYLAACPSVGKLVAFERYGEVGGMWIYTDKTGTDVDGLPVHSATYEDLRTNVPKISMAFPGFPFANEKPSFTMHGEVLEYLQAFADAFDLTKYIKFKTLVSKVDPLSPGSRDTRWAVTYCSPGKPETATTEKFDAVIVCNGHFVAPYEPPIQGKEIFAGPIIHSHDFRTTDSFRDKTVVLWGVGPTSVDIAPIVASVAKKIIFSQNPEIEGLSFQMPANAYRKPLIHHLTETSVVFDNGEEERVDAIIVCTGYRYNFPFLTEACGIVLEDGDRRVTPLYKHVVNTTHPSMMFVGLLFISNTFILFDRQAQFAAKIVGGSVVLPSKADMDRDTAQEFDSRITVAGKKPHHFHKLGMFEGEYCDSLSQIADIPTMPKYQRQTFEYVFTKLLFQRTLTFKDVEFELTPENRLRITDEKNQVEVMD